MFHLCCLKIASKHITESAWPPSPIHPATSDKQEDKDDTKQSTVVQQEVSTHTPESQNKSAQVGLLVLETEPIPQQPKDPNKRETETQTYPTMEVDKFDREEDRKQNLYSSLNIDRNARYDSDEVPNNQTQTDHIIIKTPPNNPKSDTSQKYASIHPPDQTE